uniref:Uncharacterized protein n=1 Tax=Arundo donax TaxID=35708 RepID=A0A0A9HBL7_ARUDO
MWEHAVTRLESHNLHRINGKRRWHPGVRVQTQAAAPRHGYWWNICSYGVPTLWYCATTSRTPSGKRAQ